MDRNAFLADLRASVAAIPSVRALFLGGSLGRGAGDAFSDIDLIAIVESADQSAAAVSLHHAIAAILPLVVWRERHQGVLLLNAIAEDWTRCDVTVAPSVYLSLAAKDLVRPLHDPDDLYAGLPAALPRDAADPARVAALIEEFLRVLGLLVVVDGRGEYVTGASGAAMLRQMLIDLMLEPIAMPYRGGALHLNALLSPEQRAILDRLPLPASERQAVIDAHIAIARAFLPLARQRATERGVAWPTAFEGATRAALERHFGTLIQPF